MYDNSKHVLSLAKQKGLHTVTNTECPTSDKMWDPQHSLFNDNVCCTVLSKIFYKRLDILNESVHKKI